MENRHKEIDILRGVTIITMIFIHSLSYFLNNKTAFLLWNWSNFAVGAFVFCSSYLFFNKYVKVEINARKYLKKRISRLLLPYYIFLLFFLPLNYLLNPNEVTKKYLIGSLSLTGGVDLNWLVLLFGYLSLISLLILYSFKKNLTLLVAASVLSVLSVFIFLVYRPAIPHRLTMWLPWTTILIFSLLFVLYEKRKLFHILTFISAIAIFVFTYNFQQNAGHSLGLFDNKYPPNIYFLSYQVLAIVILYWVSKVLVKSKILTQVISFFSINSYRIYFTHFIILLFFVELDFYSLGWFPAFIVFLLTTVVVQWGVNTSLNYSKIFFKKIANT